MADAAQEGWPKEALRAKLDSLQDQKRTAEAEVERLKGGTDELARLEEMAEYARNYYAEDLAGLMGYLPTVRKYETIAPKTHNPHGIYTVSEAISRPLSDDELAKKRRDRARAE